MAANILDPRMIDPSKPLQCTEIITTSLTADNITINSDLFVQNLSTNSHVNSNLVTTNLQVSTAEIINSTHTNNSVFLGSVVTTFTATTVAVSSYFFTGFDQSKLFHFDTTTQPEITAFFESINIPEGFNVGIVNTGTGIIYLSSDFTPTINTANTFNSVQHSGMFIYRVNNQLYGIGVFE